MGGVSAGPDQDTADIKMIMDGGENFVARLTALQNAKRSHDKALAELNMASDIKRGLDEAKAKNEAATKTLKDAQMKAGVLLDKANADAETIIRNSRQQIVEATKQAENIVSIANKTARELTDEKANELAEARKSRSEAETLKSIAETHTKGLAQALENARLAEVAAKKKQDEFKAKLDALNAAMLKVQS